MAAPISIAWQNDKLQSMTAKANIYVNLTKENAKGIHMSRLHLVINQLAELECNKQTAEYLLKEMVLSQSGISSQSKIQLKFEALLIS